MSFLVELLIIIILCAVANSLLGIFLVLRGNSLISFGLAHSILFGIVAAYLVVSQLNSFLLLIGAAMTGLVIVSLVELISSSRYIRYDAALGLIYLTVFAVAIILLTKYVDNAALSLNAVVTGQLVYTPFIRLTILGIDLPRAMWILGFLLFLNIGFITLFYKELMLTSFDPTYAKIIGYSPQAVSLLLMALTSLTIVGSYSVVGAILVVAFVITPPATALLLSQQIRVIIGSTIVIATIGAVSGLLLAWFLDISPTGSIAVVYGMGFLIALMIGSESQLRQQIFSTEDKIPPPPNYLIEHGGN